MSTNSTTPAGEAANPLYAYTPNKYAGYAFLVFFAITGSIHFILIFVNRAPFFLPMIIGCAMEAGSFYARAWSSKNTRLILPTVLNGLLSLGAPPFLAATVYMILCRIIVALNASRYAIIAPKWLAKLFVLSDVVCFASQIAGEILSASDIADQRQEGKYSVLAGLVLQFVIFVVFILLVGSFEMRFVRQGGADVARVDANGLDWRRHLWVLYGISVAFLVRNLFRIMEYLQGDDGFIVTHEAMLYIFDGSLMLFVTAILIFIHPGRLIKMARRVEKLGGQDFSSEMTPIRLSS